MKGDLVYSYGRRFPQRRRWSIVGESVPLGIHSEVFKKITYMYGLRSVSDITKELRLSRE